MRIKSLDELPASVRAKFDPKIGSEAAVTGKRPNKFGAKRKEVNGIAFASSWQADRYQELLMLERVDLIRDLAIEVPFALEVRNPAGEMVRIGAYVADAVFWRGEQQVVEDAKSKVTRNHPLYVWKRSHFEMQYGIRITEVERNKPRFGVES